MGSTRGESEERHPPDNLLGTYLWQAMLGCWFLMTATPKVFSNVHGLPAHHSSLAGATASESASTCSLCCSRGLGHIQFRWRFWLWIVCELPMAMPQHL
jgi:hypothetical protein